MSGTGQLEFTGQAYYAVAQDPIGGVMQALSVSLFDANGNIETNYNGDITIALGGSGPGTLSGTLTVPAVNGVATFSDVVFSAAGNYSIVASDGDGDAQAATAVNNVQPATTRCQLVVLQQPTLDPATDTFSVTVGAEDALGNLVPNDLTGPEGSALPAQITIQSGPTGAILFGTTTGTQYGTLNSNGTMTFSGLKVSLAGTYTFNIGDATPITQVITASVDLPASVPPQSPPIQVNPTPPVLPSFPPLIYLTKQEKLAQAKELRAQKIAAVKESRAEEIAATKELKAEKLAAAKTEQAAKLAAREQRLAELKAAKAAAKLG